MRRPVPIADDILRRLSGHDKDLSQLSSMLGAHLSECTLRNEEAKLAQKAVKERIDFILGAILLVGLIGILGTKGTLSQLVGLVGKLLIP